MRWGVQAPGSKLEAAAWKPEASSGQVEEARRQERAAVQKLQQLSQEVDSLRAQLQVSMWE
jgi:cell division protein FtsB